MTTKLVLASGNAGKLRELQARLKGTSYEIVPQSVFEIDAAEETGTTFVENAIIKARHAAEASGFAALADDSGLEVDALEGAPGIYSARYSGAEANDARNIAALLQALHEVPEEKRTARFRCVLVMMRSAKDATPLICQGTWEGRILTSPCGENGFGYDPIFFVPTHHCAAAELSIEIKNTISHRAQALDALIRELGR